MTDTTRRLRETVGHGQFARAGGLTVKALRFYDERGVLVPAQVDPATGYRRYRAGQLRDAVALQALRAADVGLDEAREVIDDEDRSVELIDRVQQRREAERARQDAALARARSVLGAMRDGPEGHEREAPPRAWVGPDGGDELRQCAVLDADGEVTALEFAGVLRAGA